MPTDAENLRKTFNRAVFMVFATADATDEDRKNAWDAVRWACRMDEPRLIQGIDGVINEVERAGRRGVYLDLVKGLEAGQRQRREPSENAVSSEDGHE